MSLVYHLTPLGSCAVSVPVSESQINTLVISPDKKQLAAGGNPITLIYDIQSLGTGKSAPLVQYESDSVCFVCLFFFTQFRNY